MKQELSIEKQIEEAINDVHKALLASVKAKEREVEAAQERTRTHYELLKAKERLSNLEHGLN